MEKRFKVRIMIDNENKQKEILELEFVFIPGFPGDRVYWDVNGNKNISMRYPEFYTKHMIISDLAMKYEFVEPL